jgi:hypothetical protein
MRTTLSDLVHLLAGAGAAEDLGIHRDLFSLIGLSLRAEPQKYSIITIKINLMTNAPVHEGNDALMHRKTPMRCGTRTLQMDYHIPPGGCLAEQHDFEC